jgi:hypothetical protein
MYPQPPLLYPLPQFLYVARNNYIILILVGIYVSGNL